MIELYLLRHTKSDWPLQGNSDRDRVLAPRGVKAASTIGQFMSRSMYLPDITLCSSAARTRQTLDLVAQNWKHDHKIRYSDTLYSGGAQAYFNQIREIPNAYSSAMLLAHNPTIHELALVLSGDGPAQDIARLSEKYPTGGLSVIQFSSGTWSDIGQGGGTLIEFSTPKTISQTPEDETCQTK